MLHDLYKILKNYYIEKSLSHIDYSFIYNYQEWKEYKYPLLGRRKENRSYTFAIGIKYSIKAHISIICLKHITKHVHILFKCVYRDAVEAGQ